METSSDCEVGYDLEKEEEQRPPGPIPAGHYIACVTQVEKKRNSKDTGNFVNLQWEILEGDQKGRKVMEWNINVDHESETCQRIGRGRIKNIAKAAGIERLVLYSDLINKPVRLLVGQEATEDSDYPVRNTAKHCTNLDKRNTRDKTGVTNQITERVRAPVEAKKELSDDEDDISF